MVEKMPQLSCAKVEVYLIHVEVEIEVFQSWVHQTKRMSVFTTGKPDISVPEL